MRPTQPSGTVTLVFTDIEGSTRLLHELGTSAYKEALAEHRAIVRGRAFVSIPFGSSPGPA
jgi:class 3 adenylate cyclase